MITNLELTNWRTHDETTLEFGKGTNVIIGVMGSGKSSIVNAITYTLFGTFPGLKNRSIALKEIIKNKPNQSEITKTKLTFIQEEKKYSVERIIKLDGTNEAKLYENDKFIAGPKQKDVNEKVEKILGMNYEIFSRAVYAEQNELDFFLKLSPSERKKKFDEMLQLEKYEEARKNSTSLQNEMVKENKTAKEFLEQQKNTLKSHEEEKLVQQINETEKELIVLEKNVEIAKEVIKNTEKDYQKEAEKEKINTELNNNLIKTKSKIENLKEDLKKTQKIQINEIVNKIKELKLLIEQNNAAKTDLEKETKNNNELLIALLEEKKVFNYQIELAEKEINQISSLKGTCPICKQTLDENHKTHIVEEQTEKIKKVLIEKEKREKEIEDIKKKVEQIEKEKKEIDKKIDLLKKETYVQETLEKEGKDLIEKEKRLVELEIELPKIEKIIKELNFNKTLVSDLREKYFKENNEIQINTSKIQSKKELKKSFEENLKKINEIKKNIENNEKQILQKEEAAKKLGIFSNCLIATQLELRKEMIETINSAMSNIWEKIYPYKDFIDAKLAIVEEGYDLMVLTRNNEWVRVEGILSGGERSAAALCIRMAFALVLTKNLSMLILDEPTHNLDSNSVSKLSEMLRDEMPKLVEQIFIITHDKQLEEAASSNIYLLHRDKNNDEATKVEIKSIF